MQAHEDDQDEEQDEEEECKEGLRHSHLVRDNSSSWDPLVSGVVDDARAKNQFNCDRIRDGLHLPITTWRR